MSGSPVTPEHLTAEGLLVIFDSIDGVWEVWCGADGTNIINAHLIASDAIRAVAIQQAQLELAALSARLNWLLQHGTA